MNATELRIGNLVFDDSNTPMKVVRIEAEDYTAWNSGDEFNVIIESLDEKINNYYESTINPIPLTEEWLLKFGFENEDENRFWLSPMYLLKYDDGCLYLANQRHVNIFYVHQLQNLYFALTGEELCLKMSS